MTLKKGRPATGRKESYYEINPNNFIRHMKNIKTDRLIKAYNQLHELAFDEPLKWSEKEKLKKVLIIEL